MRGRARVVVSVILILAAGGSLAQGQAPARSRMLEALNPAADQDFECADCPNGCAYAKTMRSRIASGMNPDGSPMFEAVDPASANTDLLHYDLDIEINPSTGWIGGKNTLSLKSTVNNLTEVKIRLEDNFAVSSIKLGATSLLGLRVDPATFRVLLDRPYNAGETLDIEVSYSGFPQNNGFDSILFTTQSGVPIASTLSETDFAFTWWPTKDDNRDKATADLRFTIPSTMSVASNGVLQSVTDLGGGKKKWYWKTNYQIATYLISFAVTNYNHFSGSYNWGGGVMPLEFYVYPASDTTSNRNAWLMAQQMLATYRPIYGLYPFINEKYGIYQFPFGGGMEHQTMTGQGTFSESVTSHELSHQWWGDMVTCATWNDIWLNEGFATYTEALWLERKPGSTGLPALHAAMAARRPTSVNGTVYIPEPLDTADINRIFSTNFSYRKAAWVLHMLRHMVGDDQFFAILAAWRANFEYASATTEDFRAVAESVSGLNLAPFFSQWVYGPGAPGYTRNWRETVVNGKRYVELMIKQVQTSPYPIFFLPMDVVTTVGAVQTTQVVWNNAATEWYLLPVTGPVSSLQLDPTPWILATSNTTGTFVENPPKVVEVNPAPGSSGPSASVPAITIWFQKTVATTAADYALVGDVSGPAPFTFAYDAASKSVTLTPVSGLAPDTYMLAVADSVRDTASAKQLDGEVSDPWSPASLPSGEGQPGGAAVIRFTIVPPPGCLGDADGDGFVTFSDITNVLEHYSASYGAGQTGPGDADRNGIVDFADVSMVLDRFGLPC